MHLAAKGRLQSGRSTRKIATKALKLAKKNANTELKVLPRGDTGVIPTTSWSVVRSNYFAMVQGDASTERIGNEVDLIGIRIRGHVEREDDELGNAENYWRLVLYGDSHPPALALPAPFDGNSVESQRTFAERGLKIYMDETFDLGTALHDGRGPLHFDKYFKIKKRLRYTASATADPENFDLRLMIIANIAPTSAHMDIGAQVYFKDI